MKKLLIIGASGMLGHKLALKLSKKFQVTGTVRKDVPEFFAPFLNENLNIITGVDAFDFQSIKNAVMDVAPDVVINCVGIVKQLAEAKDPVISITVNSLFPQQLQKLAEAEDFKLIHFSTDCVFSGRQGPYSEDSASDVNDLYGLTKFLGEVQGARALTIRTSIIGREFTNPTGLIEWFLSNKGGHVNGFTGAHYTGLTTNAMADVVAMVIEQFPDLNGLYQVAANSINKFELLEIVNRVANTNTKITAETQFFCDRRLSFNKFHNATGWSPETWENMIKTMFEEDKLYYINTQ